MDRGNAVMRLTMMVPITWRLVVNGHGTTSQQKCRPSMPALYQALALSNTAGEIWHAYCLQGEASTRLQGNGSSVGIAPICCSDKTAECAFPRKNRIAPASGNIVRGPGSDPCQRGPFRGRFSGFRKHHDHEVGGQRYAPATGSRGNGEIPAGFRCVTAAYSTAPSSTR